MFRVLFVESLMSLTHPLVIREAPPGALRLYIPENNLYSDTVLDTQKKTWYMMG